MTDGPAKTHANAFFASADVYLSGHIWDWIDLALSPFFSYKRDQNRNLEL